MPCLVSCILLRPEEGGTSQLHLKQGTEDLHQSLLHPVLSLLCSAFSFV